VRDVSDDARPDVQSIEQLLINLPGSGQFTYAPG
jgi:hypothetical protein